MYGGLHYDESGPQAAETQNRAGSVFPAVFCTAAAQYAGSVYLQPGSHQLKRAELQTLQEQISQQQTKNEEMQRILSGDSDEVTEWVARDSYNYAAANERIFVDVTGN